MEFHLNFRSHLPLRSGSSPKKLLLINVHHKSEEEEECLWPARTLDQIQGVGSSYLSDSDSNSNSVSAWLPSLLFFFFLYKAISSELSASRLVPALCSRRLKSNTDGTTRPVQTIEGKARNWGTAGEDRACQRKAVSSGGWLLQMTMVKTLGITCQNPYPWRKNTTAKKSISMTGINFCPNSYPRGFRVPNRFLIPTNINIKK
jgi:hypothetical protein